MISIIETLVYSYDLWTENIDYCSIGVGVLTSDRGYVIGIYGENDLLGQNAFKWIESNLNRIIIEDIGECKDMI